MRWIAPAVGYPNGLLPTDIRATAVGFGAARSRVVGTSLLPAWIATGSQTEDERREGQVTPLRRSGSADEVAWPVAWLCTPGAAYVNGQCLIVDGGNSVAEQRRV